MRKPSKTQILLTAAFAGLAAAGALAVSCPFASADAKCEGGNKCKGQSKCSTAKNSCSGQNACAGLGWVSSKDEPTCAKLKAEAKKKQADLKRK